MVLDGDSQNFTAFIMNFGLYKRKRQPISLASAPGAFQNLMELILSGLSYKTALVYLEDIITFGRTFEEHLERLIGTYSVSTERTRVKNKRIEMQILSKKNPLSWTYCVEQRCRS